MSKITTLIVIPAYTNGNEYIKEHATILYICDGNMLHKKMWRTLLNIIGEEKYEEYKLLYNTIEEEVKALHNTNRKLEKIDDNISTVLCHHIILKLSPKSFYENYLTKTKDFLDN